MNVSPRCSVVIALALFGTVALNPPAASASSGWYHDYDAAVAAARREGKPILADFSTGWCHNCRDLERNTLSDPSITSRLDSFVKVHVDGDERQDMVNSFNVSGYPTLVALTPTGHEIDRSVGYVGAGELANTLDGVMSRVGSMRRQSAPSANAAKSRSHEQSDQAQADAPDDSRVASRSAHDSHAKASGAVDPIQAPADVVVKTAKGAKSASDKQGNNYVIAESARVAKPDRQFAIADAPDAMARIKSAVPSKPTSDSRVDLVDNPTPGLLHSATRNSRVVAAADSRSGSAAGGAGDSAELPHPLLNVGSTRNSDALPAPVHEAAEPDAAPTKDPVIKKPKPASHDTKSLPVSAPVDAAATDAPIVKNVKTTSEKSSSLDPLATIKKIQAKGASTDKRTAMKLPSTPAASEGDSVEKTAVEPIVKKERVGAKNKETVSEPASDAADATPATDNSDDAPAARRGPVTKDDIGRWMKDGDDKLVAGHKKEAGAMYAKVVTNDPKNNFGRADMAYLKMCSLMVDKDDDDLRRKAYEKIKAFDARFPNSSNKDYYTLVRAMMAADLGESKSAHALLSDFPSRYPNSKYTAMAHSTLVDLGALPADKDDKSQKSDKGAKGGGSKSSSSKSSSSKSSSSKDKSSAR